MVEKKFIKGLIKIDYIIYEKLFFVSPDAMVSFVI